MDGIGGIIIFVVVILISVVQAALKSSAKKKREQGGRQQPQQQPQPKRRNVIMDEIFREMLGEEETWKHPQTTFEGHPADHWDEIYGNPAQREQRPIPSPFPSISPAPSPQYAMKGYEDSKESEMMRAYEQRSAAQTTSQAAAIAKAKKKRVGDGTTETALRTEDETNLFAEEFDLRKAVLYSEIMAPKFKEENCF